MTISKFTLVNGIPDSEQIEEWAESYFQGLLQMMNHFYSRADINEVLKSMEAAPFDQMAAKELEGESPEVIAVAMKLVNEMAQREIAYIKAYLGA
jgi:hypothetical protein